MNEELEQKLTDRFEAISAKAECDNEVRDALLKAYLAGGEYGYQYALQHPQWIPVKEELPKEQGKYMFRLSNGDMCYETYYPKLKLLDNVTHWMEIVPPRKEDKQ